MREDMIIKSARFDRREGNAAALIRAGKALYNRRAVRLIVFPARGNTAPTVAAEFRTGYTSARASTLYGSLHVYYKCLYLSDAVACTGGGYDKHLHAAYILFPRLFDIANLHGADYPRNYFKALAAFFGLKKGQYYIDEI